MKFEMVEYYPFVEPKKGFIGTVHIYAIDCELDIRGILIKKTSGGIHFNLPHFRTTELESGVQVSYPMIRWTNPATQKEMMNFLHKKVKPEILKRIENVDKQKVI